MPFSPPSALPLGTRMSRGAAPSAKPAHLPPPRQLWNLPPSSRHPPSSRPPHWTPLTTCHASSSSSSPSPSSPSLVHFLQTSGPDAPRMGAPSVSPMPLLYPLLAATAAAAYAGLLLPDMHPVLKTLAIAGPILLQGTLIAADTLLGPRLPSQPSTPPAPDSWPLHTITPTLTGLAHIGACLCTYTAAATTPLNPALLALLTYSTALSGISSFAACHELLHRSKLERAISQVLLTWSWWLPYYRQHHYHHLTMCTPDDFTTAPKGVSVYKFAPHYISSSYSKDWQLSAAECAKAGVPTLSPHNTSLRGLTAQLGITAAVYAALGPVAALLHVTVAALDLVLMAAFDYVLHYGLSRPLVSGSTGGGTARFAPVSPLHSWNSLFPLENSTVFNVAFHSDHHMAASKSYPELDPREGTPLLPGPINAIVMLSLIPPLWRAVMDPRVDEVNNKSVQVLQA